MRRACLLAAAVLILLASTSSLHAQTPSILHTFTGPDGAQPVGSFVQMPDGMLGGVTSAGGANGMGAVYIINPTSGQYTTVYSFTGGDDGSSPASGLTLGPDGTAYGTAQFGGANSMGTVFGISPTGQFKMIYAFGGTPADPAPEDGNGPNSNLIWGGDGYLWGTTAWGGAYGNGTAFHVSPNGAYGIVHSFNDDDGMQPTGGLLFASNNEYYGTSEYGGEYGYGTVFEMDLTGFDVLWDFTDGLDGGYPCAGLEEDPDGLMWGETMEGGEFDYGTIFNITFAGDLDTTYDFDEDDGDDGDFTPFLGGGGSFFGETNLGGSGGYGTLFGFSPSSPSVIQSISLNGANGAYPSGGVFQAQDGNLYTTTQYGGSDTDQGFILKIPMMPAISPILSVSLASNTIDIGQSTKLTWKVNVGYSSTRRMCYAMGNDTSEWTGQQAASGSITVAPTVAGTYTYALECGGSIVNWAALSVMKQPSTTRLASSASGPVTQGKALSLTATVTGGTGTQRPTGSVTFTATYNNAPVELATIELNNSQQAIYNADTSIIPAGSYPVTASYSGDSTFAGSTSAPVTVTIAAAKTASSTAVSLMPDPPTVNKNVTLTATVTGDGPTGTVTFGLGGAFTSPITLQGGVATYSVVIPSLYCGANTVTASYSGDANNTSSSGSATANIITTSTTTVSASPQSVKQGSSSTLTATVLSGCDPTGSVTFTADGVTLGSAPLTGTTATYVATVSTYIATGVYTVQATYSGDATHLASSGTTSVTVTAK